jgi:hypothetical protein
VMAEVGTVERAVNVVGVSDLFKIETFFQEGCCGMCIARTGKSLGDKSRFEEMKLSVIYVNSVTSFCWVHNFVDLTLNLTLRRGSEIEMKDRFVDD